MSLDPEHSSLGGQFSAHYVVPKAMQSGYLTIQGIRFSSAPHFGTSLLIAVLALLRAAVPQTALRAVRVPPGRDPNQASSKSGKKARVSRQV